MAAWKASEGEDAFGLVADVEEDGVGGDGGYGAFDLLIAFAGVARVGVLILGEDFVKGLGEGLSGFRDGIGFGGDRVRHERLRPQC